MGENGGRQIRFQDFEFDPASDRLFRQGAPVPIQPQPLKVLRFLLEHAGETVSRQELHDHIWGDATYVEFDQGLNYCIRHIRRALGDNAVNPLYLETLPKQGYRFRATVDRPGSSGKIVTAPTPAELPKIDQPEERLASVRPSRTKRAWWAGIGSCALLIVVAASLYFGRNPNIQSLAVLPMLNLSGDPGQEYLADSMTEELTTMLAKNSRLRIISRTSAMQYKSVPGSVRQIAKSLGADGVLEGSLSRHGDRVHLSIQLIDARSDAHMWAESFDRDINGTPSLPQEVAQSVAARLHRTTPQTVSVRYLRPEAHDAYVHGRYLWITGHNDKAGEYFLKATQLQPDYSLAWAGVADYYALGAVDGLTSPKNFMGLAKAAAQKAVALDDSSAQAHVTSGAVAFFADWNFSRALGECNRAIQLDSSFPEAYHLKAKLLGSLKQHDEAIEAERRAMEISPFSRPWALVYILLRARQFDAAINEAQARLESAPMNLDLLSSLQEAYRSKGMMHEAVETEEKILKLGGDGKGAAALTQTFQKGGYRAVVRGWLTDAENESKQHYVSPVFLASLTAQLGERDETLGLLEQGYRERSPLLLDVQFDPAFDFLRSEARYQSIIEKVGLPPQY